MIAPTCRQCGGKLPDQAKVGRPRSYCSTGCRRAAEYELRRTQSLVLHSEKQEMAARAKLARYPASEQMQAQVNYWSAQVDHLKGALAELLGDIAEEEVSGA